MANLKLILLLIVFMICKDSKSQKISKYKYGAVDTVITYFDAEVIIYKNGINSFKRDTIWYGKQKHDIDIDFTKVFIQEGIKLKQKLAGKMF